MPPMPLVDVTYEPRGDGVVLLTLNRPRRNNAFRLRTYADVANALRRAAHDDAVAVVVLTGAGGKFYSSGNDMGLDTGLPDVEHVCNEERQVVNDMVAQFVDFPKILVAAVNGPAYGIAATSLQLCDLVYASPQAKFVTPFTNLSLCAEGCSSVMFPFNMGTQAANEMLLLSKPLSAEDAVRHNFVLRLYPHDELLTTVLSIAERIGKLPRDSLLTTKRLQREPLRRYLHGVNVAELNEVHRLSQGPEFAEAVVKFMSRKNAPSAKL